MSCSTVRLAGGGARLTAVVRDVINRAQVILPFDSDAAEVYGPLRARLESAGRTVAEPDLRIACIALRHDLTLVIGNVCHFEPVADLRVENWLRPSGT